MTLAECRVEPITYLDPYNYKLNAKIGCAKADQCNVLSVPDRGTGPNLIREGCCPQYALKKINTLREVVNSKTASDHQMEVMGLVHLQSRRESIRPESGTGW